MQFRGHKSELDLNWSVHYINDPSKVQTPSPAPSPTPSQTPSPSPTPKPTSTPTTSNTATNSTTTTTTTSSTSAATTAKKLGNSFKDLIQAKIDGKVTQDDKNSTADSTEALEIEDILTDSFAQIVLQDEVLVLDDSDGNEEKIEYFNEKLTELDQAADKEQIYGLVSELLFVSNVKKVAAQSQQTFPVTDDTDLEKEA